MMRFAVSALFLLLTSFAAAQARAESTPNGLSVDVGFESYSDHTVSEVGGGNLHDGSIHLGAGLLGNLGDLAVGVAASRRVALFGDESWLVGGRLGWQPTLGQLRVQLLANFGYHGYAHVGGGLFGETSPSSLQMPYVGGELGIKPRLRDGSRFELGMALLVRRDLETMRSTFTDFSLFGASEYPPTAYRVGGTMVGASLTIGFRFERARR